MQMQTHACMWYTCIFKRGIAAWYCRSGMASRHATVMIYLVCVPTQRERSAALPDKLVQLDFCQ